MICTMRCCRWIVDSLRSTCCEECSSLRIPPDPNETSVRGSMLQRNILATVYLDKEKKFKGELYNILKVKL